MKLSTGAHTIRLQQSELLSTRSDKYQRAVTQDCLEMGLTQNPTHQSSYQGIRTSAILNGRYDGLPAGIDDGACIAQRTRLTLQARKWMKFSGICELLNGRTGFLSDCWLNLAQ